MIPIFGPFLQNKYQAWPPVTVQKPNTVRQWRSFSTYDDSFFNRSPLYGVFNIRLDRLWRSVGSQFILYTMLLLKAETPEPWDGRPARVEVNGDPVWMGVPPEKKKRKRKTKHTSVKPYNITAKISDWLTRDVKGEEMLKIEVTAHFGLMSLWVPARSHPCLIMTRGKKKTQQKYIWHWMGSDFMKLLCVFHHGLQYVTHEDTYDTHKEKAVTRTKTSEV